MTSVDRMASLNEKYPGVDHTIICDGEWAKRMFKEGYYPSERTEMIQARGGDRAFVMGEPSSKEVVRRRNTPF